MQQVPSEEIKLEILDLEKSVSDPVEGQHLMKVIKQVLGDKVHVVI